MKEKRSPLHIDEPATNRASMFDRSNYTWMLIGAAVMVVGFLLMGGGRSADPNVFDANEVYSTTRITIAPILILAGLVIEIYAIFRHPKA
ncbi:MULTISPECIES: DUF3098 domain-containing protein [Chitinophagaceae]|uniref:DUF3098 domain-containing protein n=1 Tax=Chitinophagaceae TaxID=563835 RepID=UPI000DF01D00|nr:MULTISPECIES: DUF3098 domain-containing protein [Chitinophagaceae]RPD48275.1 DUF3098 domain-containing protein [Paracnuella aquatica]